MTISPEAQARPSWSDALAVYFKPRVLIVMFLGFSSGLPLALSGTTLLVWMRESGVDLGTIGLFALVGTPYTVKFLWAPFTDALDVPVLSRLLGRRRGWLVFTQILLMAAIVFLGSCNPAAAPGLVALGALLVATASATQDIVVDAFRVESLPENEQAAGMASYVAAYRIGMLISTAGALFLVSAIEAHGFDKQAAWRWGYVAMAALVLIGTATALFATEPERSAQAEVTHAGQKPFARVSEAAVGAFRDFLGHELALVMLAFVVLFKFTDALSGAMTAPFVIDLGFSRNEYAAIVKGVGLAALLLGGFAGGFHCARASARRMPVDRRYFAIRRQPGVQCFGGRRHQHDDARGRHHCGEFHQRHRHGDVRRLPLCSLPKSTAHGDAICAADCASCGRTHLSFIRCRIHRRIDRLGVVLRDMHAGRHSELAFARLATAARTLQAAGAEETADPDERPHPSRSLPRTLE